MYRISCIPHKLARQYINNKSSIYFINVLIGCSQGIIWADDKENPGLLLIWSEYQEGFQLMGQALGKEHWKDFYKWFQESIPLFLKERGIGGFEYGVDTQGLQDMMSGIFYDRDIECEKQKIFYFEGTLVKMEPPEGYSFERVDEDFFNKKYYNLEYIANEIESAYGTRENYLKKGYGYAAIKDNEIVARAIMTFSFEGENNISVDTLEYHRRKGLSSYLTSMAIDETLRINCAPIWDCNEYNIASEKTALKCGLKRKREDYIYWFSI